MFELVIRVIVESAGESGTDFEALNLTTSVTPVCIVSIGCLV